MMKKSLKNFWLRQLSIHSQIAGRADIFYAEALIAAYTPEGAAWTTEEVAYIQKNVDLVETYVAEKMPGVTMIRPEGTFLCWLDLSQLRLGDEEILKRVIVEAAVICVPGPWFGAGGEEHLRLNVGCPKVLLIEALDRIQEILYK